MLKLGLWMIRPCDVVAVARDGGHVGVRTRGGETISAKLEPSEACAAEQAMLSAMTDPWRPGAHDEERLEVGAQQQIATGERCPPAEAYGVDGWQPAPRGAGMWRHDGPVPDVGPSWMRWLVPVQP